MFIFLDESGNFYGNKDSHFNVGGFLTSSPRQTAKAFRKWQHAKFPKTIRFKTEVKFTDSGLTDELRGATLSYLAKQNIRIFYSFLKVANIPSEFRKKDALESGLLYTRIVSETLQLLLPNDEREFRVFRDERHLKSVPQTKFNEMVKLDVALKLPKNAVVQIESVNSATNANIQIADWICGALFHYYHKQEHGERYFASLKNSIIASQELFQDTWDFESNKKSPS